ncbi:MAG: NFACT family protein [Pyrinomonadaceae bacterium]|nr:NFACT family protein [Pyrinomonadaceae bacterium]
MNNQLIGEIVAELAPVLEGRVWGKVWQVGRATVAADLRLSGNHYLFISVEPQQARLHLVERPMRALEKASLAPSNFVLALKKHLGGARVLSVTKDEHDRIVRFAFASYDATGATRDWSLIAQLTGRAANLLLLDGQDRVVEFVREPRAEGQQRGAVYQPPPTNFAGRETPALDQLALKGAQFPTLSAALDNYYQRREAERAFATRAGEVAARLRQAIDKRRKLERNLERDLTAHGDADEHKRVGDLLLANIATAERAGSRVRLIDYYAAGTPVVELEIDEHATLPEEAARRFARYTKAKRAAQEIAGRLAEARHELSELEERCAELERITLRRDEAALEEFAARQQQGPTKKPQQQQSPRERAKATNDGVPGGRRYRSSDGYEILVGRGAKDNDHLTFRVARSHDLWLHAADYPGSHVVVRNHARNADVPHRTIIEAAQLAAQFSHAKRDAKVAVNYTQRKFIAKPKGAAPGLVRMSSFRTLLVEPGENVERL